MIRRLSSRKFALWISILFLYAGAGAVVAQIFGGGGRNRNGRGRQFSYDLPPRDIFPADAFTFCRIEYSTSNYGRPDSWNTDYPESDVNFPRRLAEATTINAAHTEDGQIKHVIVRMDDPEIFKYPFAYMLEVESMELSEPERKGMRDYLLRGGFIMVDDFWGDPAWNNLEYELGQVLPPDEYPIFDIPLDHEIFHIVFDIKEYPQIPSVGGMYNYQTAGITYETQHSYSQTRDTGAHYRGVRDKNGRLMMVIAHNTDLGDGWEEESTDAGYFREFSVKKAFPMGVNIVVYAMTH